MFIIVVVEWRQSKVHFALLEWTLYSNPVNPTTILTFVKIIIIFKILQLFRESFFLLPINIKANYYRQIQRKQEQGQGKGKRKGSQQGAVVSASGGYSRCGCHCAGRGDRCRNVHTYIWTTCKWVYALLRIWWVLDLVEFIHLLIHKENTICIFF